MSTLLSVSQIRTCENLVYNWILIFKKMVLTTTFLSSELIQIVYLIKEFSPPPPIARYGCYCPLHNNLLLHTSYAVLLKQFSSIAHCSCTIITSCRWAVLSITEVSRRRSARFWVQITAAT